MSFARKRGGVWYLYWKVREPSPGSSLGFVWRQKSKAISTDKATFEEFRRRFDYTENRTRLGLANDRMDWADFKSKFLPHKRGKTLEAYEGAFRRFESIAAPGRIAEFSYQMAQSYRARLSTWISPTLGRPISDVTKNIDIRCMRATWAEAKRAGYVSENVFVQVQEFKTTKKRKRYLSKEELNRVISEAGRSESDGAYLMVLLIKYTGVRKSELVNMRWSWFDLERGHLVIRAGDGWEPKDREEHGIGLHDELLGELRKRRKMADGDYVFPGKNGGPRDHYAVGRLFNRIYARAGVDARGVHILRHTFATHSGLAPRTLQSVLGHSDLRTTQGYTHVTPEDLEALKRVKY